jgi:hypothetical protein
LIAELCLQIFDAVFTDTHSQQQQVSPALFFPRIFALVAADLDSVIVFIALGRVTP